jgi:NADH-quinone oxidoreductase subunit M
VSRLPILSIITWSPFLAALVIMAAARHRPLLVRGTAVLGAAIPLALSVWLCFAYDRATAGFQFGEHLPLVPSFGISYELAIDGMGLVLVLLTAIILFAGVFASWTVQTRGQEFYALLLLLVTGVFGVFVSFDLFVFFLF